jgi:putative membrane protein
MNALGSWYLLIKALHVVFMVTWFAGLFYLPRLFIYHAEAADSASRERFQVMEKRLFAIMTIGAVLTAMLGTLLLGINHALLSVPWFHVKLLLLAGLIVYHYRCYRWIARLASTGEAADSKWLRWFNEIPVFFLLTIVILAVTKPALG